MIEEAKMLVPNVGDRVSVWKSVLGRGYRAEGIVERLQRERTGQIVMYVQDDWWVCENDIENGFEVIAPPDAHCRLCGEIGVDMQPGDVSVSYDESGGEDEAGCFVEHHTEWQCADRQHCRQNRREMWKLQQDIDRWADMEAREAGRGGRIGGGV
jgi:hypothetical protein